MFKILNIKLWKLKIKINIIKNQEISKDKVCLEARIEPKIEYLDLLKIPKTIKKYTLNPIKHIKNKKLPKKLNKLK